MANFGQCPVCKQIVRGATVERITISAGPRGANWVGVSYVCLNIACRTVLGVSFDPVSLQQNIVKEIRKQPRAVER